MSRAAQPPPSEAYIQTSNYPTTTKTPHEVSTSSSSASSRSSDPKAEVRKSSDGDVNQVVGATPSSLGYGVRDASGDRGDDEVGELANELDGEQMRAPGEGEVSSAQRHKTGFGEQEDLASDLDRKREEQERIKVERGAGGRGDEGVDVKGAVAGEGKVFVGVQGGKGGSGAGLVDEMAGRGVGGGL